MLRAHVEEFGTVKDSWLFANGRGGVVASTTYWRVWGEARHLALTPEQVASPLAARPYDLRPAGALLVAQRWRTPLRLRSARGQQRPGALSRYAKCLDGRQDVDNRRIGELLGEGDGQEDEHGDGS
ncbi:hypothetical protein PV367_40675 [Streptomyces europaeiscabiei]|uniref:Integrase n=1 Tax=Streptomyces europaeiscabiei TaxID=146819 RepID=A0AAJ2URW5_9ACTN|nr:hypothetical protein [Streptomyces europaeiscabiei]MDX3135971.1 hypothetical protein [Streptomyces europaeiscabiei]